MWRKREHLSPLGNKLLFPALKKKHEISERKENDVEERKEKVKKQTSRYNKYKNYFKLENCVKGMESKRGKVINKKEKERRRELTPKSCLKLIKRK